MVDASGRPVPRFPAWKEPYVRDAMAAVLDGWGVGKSDICICGGARGGDILFAELCLRRGADMRLFLPLEKRDFLEASVRLPAPLDSGWEDRFETIAGKSATCWPLTEADSAPTGNPFSRNNARMVDHAISAAQGGDILTLLLWDGKGGDGPGGTSEIAHRLGDGGAEPVVIDPTQLQPDGP